MADVSFRIIKKNVLKKWINSEISLKSKSTGNINVILCSDDYLLEINRKYLNHDFLTDIITFNYNSNSKISGDLFISLPRIIENASSFNVSAESEFYRVVIHGVLHLLGYDDDSILKKKLIHELEDEALNRLYKLFIPQ